MNDELKSKYKHFDPQTLVGYGLLESARNSGYICPKCGNGTGEDGTGIEFDLVNDGYKGYCFKCDDHFDVFDLIALKYHYNETQFPDIFHKAEEIFGYNPATMPAPSFKKSQQKTVDLSYIIQSSWTRLNEFFEGRETFRGLTKETLVKFACGYDPKYFHRGKITPRLIVPTSLNHYLARYVGAEEIDASLQKLHKGAKEIFGLKFAQKLLQEKPTSLVYAVEGEIDAMSIYQCGFTAIAFSGANISKHQQALLDEFPKGSKFILMFDADDTGKMNAQKNAETMRAHGLQVSVQFLDEKFHDANDWLQADPDGLKAELERIYSLAEKFFTDNPPAKNSELPQGIIEITPDYKPSNPPAIPEITPQEVTYTKKQMPSCPIDLTVPKGYHFKPYGLLIDVFDKNGNPKPPKLFSHTPIVPTRIIYSQDRAEMQVELACYDRAKNAWHKFTVNATTIAKTSEITALAGFGVDVNSPHSGDFSNFLMKILHDENNAQKIPHTTTYAQPGWVDNSFTKYIYPPDIIIVEKTEMIEGESAMVKDSGFNYASKFTSAGDKNEWLELLKTLAVQGNWWARFVFGIALAAPIVQICKTRNWQVALVSKSGAGKSAVAELAISVFGNPDKYKEIFNATPNFTDTLSPRLNGLPCWVDEFQTANKVVRENFPTLIYNYAEGKTRGRLNKNAEAKEQFEFHGTRICTSEEAVIPNNTTQGAFNRLIQIKGFKPLPDEWSRHIHETLQKTYGHFGKPWIEYVAAHKDEICATYQALQEKYADKKFVPQHLQSISSAYTACEFFWKMLMETDEYAQEILGAYSTPLQYLDKIKRDGEMLGDIDYFRVLLPTPEDADNATRAIEFLKELCYSHRKNFGTFEKLGSYDGKDFKTQPTFVTNQLSPCIGYILENGDVGFLPGEMNRILRENHYPDADTLMREFFEKGWVEISDNNDKLAKKFKKQKRIREVGSRAVYYFPALVAEPDDT